MKIKELKEMIKNAFIAENYVDDDPALQRQYNFLDEADVPINIVTTMDGKTIVGTHQYGVGFKSNEAGKKMGFNDHPTSIPNGTKMSKDDSLYETEVASEEEIEDIIYVIDRITRGKNDPYNESKIAEVKTELEKMYDSLETLSAQADDEKFKTLLNNVLTMIRQHMHGDRKLDLKALKDTIEKGDFDAFAKFQRSVTEAKDEEETDITVDAEEETTDGGEEKLANDSIVVDKKIVSLSSLPQQTRKILDSLETLRAQAEEFGDQKFITQVGNTITFFTRDFVVAGDEPTKAKVDESLEILKMKKLAGLLKEGEYAKALLRENQTNFPSEDKIKEKGAVGDSVTVSKNGKNYDINYTVSSGSDDEMSFGIYDSEEGEDAEQVEEFYTYKELINWFNN
jgi:hypothetical protein